MPRHPIDLDDYTRPVVNVEDEVRRLREKVQALEEKTAPFVPKDDPSLPIEPRDPELADLGLRSDDI